MEQSTVQVTLTNGIQVVYLPSGRQVKSGDTVLYTKEIARAVKHGDIVIYTEVETEVETEEKV